MRRVRREIGLKQEAIWGQLKSSLIVLDNGGKTGVEDKLEGTPQADLTRLHPQLELA